MTVLLWSAAVLLVLAGLAGTLLPALPGAPLVFLGLLLAAWIDGFQKVGGLLVTVLAILTILALVADVVAAAYGATRVDASRQAFTGAMIGMIVGLAGGLPGLILGPMIGAAIGEFIARRDLIRKGSSAEALAKAGQVGLATWLGLVIGSAAKLALCFVMVGLFITAYFWK